MEQGYGGITCDQDDSSSKRFRKQQWKHQLQSLKQKNGDTIDEYVSKITELWKRLDLHDNRAESDKIAGIYRWIKAIVHCPSSIKYARNRGRSH